MNEHAKDGPNGIGHEVQWFNMQLVDPNIEGNITQNQTASSNSSTKNRLLKFKIAEGPHT